MAQDPLAPVPASPQRGALGFAREIDLFGGYLRGQEAIAKDADRRAQRRAALEKSGSDYLNKIQTKLDQPVEAATTLQDIYTEERDAIRARWDDLLSQPESEQALQYLTQGGNIFDSKNRRVPASPQVIKLARDLQNTTADLAQLAAEARTTRQTQQNLLRIMANSPYRRFVVDPLQRARSLYLQRLQETGQKPPRRELFDIISKNPTSMFDKQGFDKDFIDRTIKQQVTKGTATPGMVGDQEVVLTSLVQSNPEGFLDSYLSEVRSAFNGLGVEFPEMFRTQVDKQGRSWLNADGSLNEDAVRASAPVPQTKEIRNIKSMGGGSGAPSEIPADSPYVSRVIMRQDGTLGMTSGQQYPPKVRIQMAKITEPVDLGSGNVYLDARRKPAGMRGIFTQASGPTWFALLPDGRKIPFAASSNALAEMEELGDFKVIKGENGVFVDFKKLEEVARQQGLAGVVGENGASAGFTFNVLENGTVELFDPQGKRVGGRSAEATIPGVRFFSHVRSPKDPEFRAWLENSVSAFPSRTTSAPTGANTPTGNTPKPTVNPPAPTGANPAGGPRKGDPPKRGSGRSLVDQLGNPIPPALPGQ